jgi:hypothetical protein
MAKAEVLPVSPTLSPVLLFEQFVFVFVPLFPCPGNGPPEFLEFLAKVVLPLSNEVPVAMAVGLVPVGVGVPGVTVPVAVAVIFGVVVTAGVGV